MDKINKLSEELLKQFYELKQAKKEIDDEISRIRRQILTYFNENYGENINSESQIGNFVVQRKVRKVEKFDDVKTVKKLKELGLEECIMTVEKPDEDKLQSAISLKFIKEEDLDGCIKYKYTPYLTVEKYANK
ncbi:hypothetical protein ACLIA0_12420 [Bacillaceae bacterium W0354]